MRCGWHGWMITDPKYMALCLVQKLTFYLKPLQTCQTYQNPPVFGLKISSKAPGFTPGIGIYVLAYILLVLIT